MFDLPNKPIAFSKLENYFERLFLCWVRFFKAKSSGLYHADKNRSIPIKNSEEKVWILFKTNYKDGRTRPSYLVPLFLTSIKSFTYLNTGCEIRIWKQFAFFPQSETTLNQRAKQVSHSAGGFLGVGSQPL